MSEFPKNYNLQEVVTTFFWKISAKSANF